MNDKDDVNEQLDGMVPVGRRKRQVIKRNWGESMQQKPPGERPRNLTKGLLNVRASKAHSRVSDVMAADVLADLRKSLGDKDNNVE